MNEKVSVIMPAYNAEKTIAKSIETVLRQTYKNLELLIIDDDSRDNTSKIVAYYQKKDSRIRYRKKKNEGVSAARNLGLDIAKGDYISFLDADDLWKSDFLEKLYSKITSNQDIHFVYGRTEEVFLNGTKKVMGVIPNNPEGYLENFIYKTNELRLGFHICALLIERTIIEKNHIRFEPGIKISEDTGFLIELLCVVPVYQVNENLTYYIRHNNSATGKEWNPKDWVGQVLIYKYVEDFVKKHRLGAFPYFCRMRNYVAYHFIRNCIRYKEITVAQKYIEKWQDYLKEFCHDDGRITNRLKCYLFLKFKNNKKIIEFIGNL